jgi:nucleoid-associated protein YgaU
MMNSTKIMVEVMAGVHAGALFSLPFNPEEYSETLTNTYKEKELVGLKSAKEQFKNAKVGDLTLNLLFDTTATGTDVREQLGKLAMISDIDAELHAPAPCRLIWSSLVYQGVVTRYTRQFTYFYNDGTPARARVTLTLKPFKSTEEVARENELHSSDVTKQHWLKEGETLFGLAHTAYNDPGAWRLIAEANNIDDPFAVIPGTPVTIPPRGK